METVVSVIVLCTMHNYKHSNCIPWDATIELCELQSEHTIEQNWLKSTTVTTALLSM
jgi:hypothetical protein